MNLVVGNRDRLSNPIRHGAGFPFQAGSQHAQRHVGGLATCLLAADAIDEDQKAAGHVEMEPILVDFASKPGVGAARRRQSADRLHEGVDVRSTPLLFARSSSDPHVGDDESHEHGQKNRAGPEQQRHQSTFRNSRKTVSARPIRAVSGSIVSTLIETRRNVAAVERRPERTEIDQIETASLRIPA